MVGLGTGRTKLLACRAPLSLKPLRSKSTWEAQYQQTWSFLGGLCKWRVPRRKYFGGSSHEEGVQESVFLFVCFFLPWLGSWGCCDKWPQTGWLPTTEIYLLTVPGARSLKSRCHALSKGLGENPSLPPPAPAGSRGSFAVAVSPQSASIFSSICVSPLSWSKDTCHRTLGLPV